MTVVMAKSPKGEITEQQRQRGKKFGAWVRVGIANRGWNKKKLAEEADMSPSYVGVLANDGINNSTGAYQRPSEEVIRQIANALLIDEDEGRIAAGWSPLRTREPFEDASVPVPAALRAIADQIEDRIDNPIRQRSRYAFLANTDEPEPEIERTPTGDREVIEAFTGMPEPLKGSWRVAILAAAADAHKDRSDIIGKRADRARIPQRRKRKTSRERGERISRRQRYRRTLCKAGAA